MIFPTTSNRRSKGGTHRATRSMRYQPLCRRTQRETTGCLSVSEQKNPTIAKNFTSIKLTLKHEVCREAVVDIQELRNVFP